MAVGKMVLSASGTGGPLFGRKMVLNPIPWNFPTNAESGPRGASTTAAAEGVELGPS